MIYAVAWNIIFLLAAFSIAGTLRKRRFSEIRFLTDSRIIAIMIFVICVAGALLIGYMLVKALETGLIEEVCRRCLVRGVFNREIQPFEYWASMAALVEIIVILCFSIFFTVNTLRIINRERA